MHRLLAVIVLVLMSFASANAQTVCSRSWLNTQRTVTTTVNWDEFIDPLARFHRAQYLQLPSDATQTFSIPLALGNRYTLLFYTEADALASGIEIYDPRGVRLEFQKVYGKMRNNAIELTLEPVYSGAYTFAVRSIYPNDRSACAALLIREYDDVEWEERLELLGITE